MNIEPIEIWVPIWGTNVGYQCGLPMWGTNLGYTIRVINWGTKLGYQVGVSSWGSKLGFQIGAPNWGTHYTIGVTHLGSKFSKGIVLCQPEQNKIFSIFSAPKIVVTTYLSQKGYNLRF